MTIDWWTLGIQTVNVAILVWLLQRFFWRPVAAMIEQRRDATRRVMAEAAAAKAQATAALAEIEQTRAGFAKEREAILAAAHVEAETTRAALLAEARQQAASIETAARRRSNRPTGPPRMPGTSGRPASRSPSRDNWLRDWMARRCAPRSSTGWCRRSQRSRYSAAGGDDERGDPGSRQCDAARSD